MAKIILGLVGERGSGKDAGTDYLTARYGAAVHKFSAPMGDCLRALGVPTTTPNLIAFSEYTREGRKVGQGLMEPDAEITLEAIDSCLARLHIPREDYLRTQFRQLICRMAWSTPGFGDDLYSKVVAKKCLSERGDIAIANGIRRMADVADLTPLKEFHLLYITAPEQVRYERVRNRGEKAEEHGLTLEAFRATQLTSTEVDIPRIGKEFGEFKFNNVGSLEAYRTFLDSVIKALA